MGVISKLANWVRDGLDSTSRVKGSIKAANAYADDVDLLEAELPELSINITGGKYIRFADPAVLAVLNDSRYAGTFHSDGVGITSAAALLITSLSPNQYTHPFRQNTDIVSFDELAKLTNVTSLSAYEFNQDTNLESIDLKNVEVIGQQAFRYCTNLTSIGESSKLKEIGSYTFADCTSLTSIDTSSVEIIREGAFYNCPITSFDCSKIKTLEKQNMLSFTGRLSLPSLETFSQRFVAGTLYITHIDSLGVITEIPAGDQFAYMNGCVGITLPATLVTMNDNNLANLSGNLRYVKVLATTPPTLPTTGNDISNKTNLKVYVPDSANDAVLNAYKAASGWSMFASKIYNMSQFAIDFPNE